MPATNLSEPGPYPVSRELRCCRYCGPRPNGSGQAGSWSDTQAVATVASGSLAGIARIEQNDPWSNVFGFRVLPPGSNSVAQITSRRNPVPARYAATQM